MKSFIQKYLLDILLVVIALVYFVTHIGWTYQYFTETASYEYILLLFVSLGFLLYSIRNDFDLRPTPRVRLLFFWILLGILSVDLINVFFLHYDIVRATTLILGLYTILGLYVKRRAWLHGLYIVGITALSLPFVEHIQTFLGFPIRIATAHVVSWILGLLGIVSISDASILVTENNATSIDVPCSGIKSIYTGLVVLLMLFFAKRIKVSLGAIALSILYFGLLLLFNVWRVFSLVYIYDVLAFPEFADAIHIGIGLLGFVISVIVFVKLADRLKLPTISSETKKESTAKTISKKVLLTLFIASFGLQSIGYVISDSAQVTPSKEVVFSAPGASLTELTFSSKEKEFFVNRDVQFSKKYEGKTGTGRAFSLLLVSSDSWRTHHKPEICLQGIGHSIENSEIVQFDSIVVRKLTLNEGNDTVLYWYVNGDDTVMDYSERVWKGVGDRDAVWTLVEIGFAGPVDLDSKDVYDLVYEVHTGASLLDH